MSRIISKSDVKKHNLNNDLWLIIHNDIYDVTKFLSEHPGGEDTLLDNAGKDATGPFEDVGHSEDARELLKKYKIGTLPREEQDTGNAEGCCPRVPKPAVPVKEPTCQGRSRFSKKPSWSSGNDCPDPKCVVCDRKPWQCEDHKRCSKRPRAPKPILRPPSWTTKEPSYQSIYEPLSPRPLDPRTEQLCVQCKSAESCPHVPNPDVNEAKTRECEAHPRNLKKYHRPAGPHARGSSRSSRQGSQQALTDLTGRHPIESIYKPLDPSVKKSRHSRGEPCARCSKKHSRSSGANSRVKKSHVPREPCESRGSNLKWYLLAALLSAVVVVGVLVKRNA